MQMFVARSDDEGTKIFSGKSGDEKMNDGNGRGNFNDWVSATIYGNMRCWAELAWREARVMVNLLQSSDNENDGVTPTGKVKRVWIDERRNVEVE